MAETRAEELVRQLHELSAEYSKLDDYQRSIRLGRSPAFEGRRTRLRRMVWPSAVYGGGWLDGKAEPMPFRMSGEFYTFLGDKIEAVSKQIREVKVQLAALETKEV